MSSTPPSDRPVFNDRYEIHSRIGRGGMADVFLARDRLLDRPVAVKVLFPEFAADPAFVERFRREAQAAANLSHPNIVGVYDWGRAGSTYFIVMEYVNGRTVADILRAEGPIMPQRAADIASDVAAALGFAHRNGVVHRDVKPANILVSPNGAVKVADFGIARALNTASEQGLTQTGAVMGTATYFSPEQAQGSNPDPRSDLYSLGIVMYEMVTGRPPFTGDNPVAIAYKQVHDQPVPPSELKPDVPRSYEAITLKLLAKNPAARYPSADDLRADLRRFREGHPVAALAGATAMAATTVTAVTRPAPEAAATQAVPYAPTRVQPTQRRPGPPPPSTRDEEPRRSVWILVGALVALAILAIGAVLLFRSLADDDSGGDLLVLDVTGRPLAEAKQLLSGLGLQTEDVPEPNDAVPELQVHRQEPLPNTRVERGDVVRLFFNPQRAPVALPNLTGKTRAEAEQALSALGLAYTIVEEITPDYPRDVVFAQNPGPGNVPASTNVTLRVSLGRGEAEVPNVIGLDQVAAAAQLAGRGFSVKTAPEPSETVETGKVIRTDPAPGTRLERGSDVTMVVSAGRPLVEVPRVIDLTESQARDQLQAARFLASVTTVDVPFGSAQDGHVIAQSPTPGSRQPQGSTVTITVGKALPAPTTTAATSTTVAQTTTTRD